MDRAIQTSAVAVLAILSGCVEVEDPESLADPTEPVVQRLSAPDVLCDETLQIAVRDTVAPPGMDCPSVAAWAPESLFGEGTPWLEDDSEPVPPAMRGMCRYRFTGSLANFDSTKVDYLEEQLTNVHDFAAVSPRCTIVGGEGDALTDTLGPALRDIFHLNVGRPSATNLGLSSSGTASPTVTVMVVDTAPADLAQAPSSHHGRHMGNIVNDIACPDDASDCLTQLGYTIGLPRLSGGTPDYVKGGYVGTQDDVAAAIYEATRRWEESNANLVASGGVATKLVLNLSLGWELEVFGATQPNLDAADQAVITALEHASCKGALIVASAGNGSAVCGASGPVFPAVWEERLAPLAGRCQALGVTNSQPGNGAGYRPLVYAVGGLGVNLSPMPRSRPGARAHLMASATHVAAGDPIHGGLTGTSVAAAVASGAAALVWSYRPDLDAADVMDWVYSSGDAVPGTYADFGLGAQQMLVRRVDACQSLSNACADPNANCPATLSLQSCLDTAPASTATLVADVAALDPEDTLEFDFSDTATQCFDACGDPVDVYTDAGVVDACGNVALDPMDEFVNPTPGSIGCPSCGVDDNIVYAAVHSCFAGVQINEAHVTLTADTGAKTLFKLGEVSLSVDKYAKIELDVNRVPENVVAAEIMIEFEGYAATEDDLWIR